jgi:hypothetical protein
MKHRLLSGDQFVKQIHGSLETFFLLLEEAHGDGGKNSRLLSQLNGIEAGIAFIQGAITNRLQAGRYLYEPALFNPHNMGPFSKLYSFYESFVDLFERLLTQYNNLRNEAEGLARMSLLIDISIYSSVHAESYLPVTCKKIPDKVLVGITINERSFFQMKGTMVLLLHEIGRYVRPFDRRKRNLVLRNIVFAWLVNMVYGELMAYLDTALPSNDTASMKESEQDKIRAVRKHFEDQLFQFVDPIITKTLARYFNEVVKSEPIIIEFGGDPYVSLLDQFYEFLDSYFTKLSNHLSVVLLSSKDSSSSAEESTMHPVSKTPESPIKAIILKLLSGQNTPADEIDPEPEIENLGYFERLCKTAMALFDEGALFDYRSTSRNLDTDPALAAYLKSLSLLGINEATDDNQQHFTGILMQCIKKAIETMKHELVLGMLIKNLEQALAHMFWIRTLNIRDFDSYWEIVEPLMLQTAFDEEERIRDFGIPNAIITEYFDLIQHGKILEERQYKIPPINASTPLPGVSARKPSSSTEQWIDDLRYIIFIPMAKYLGEEDEIFPETHLFQQYSDRPASEDAKLIENLRNGFKNFMRDAKADGMFEQEMQIINFFSNSSEVR